MYDDLDRRIVKYAVERADIYRAAASELRDAGQEEAAARLEWDAQLFTPMLHFVPKATEPHFGPIAEFDGVAYGHPDAIEDAALLHFEERARTSPSPSVRARYAHYLWEQRRRVEHAHKWARVAVGEYILAARDAAADTRWCETASYLMYAIVIARSLGDKPLLGETANAALDVYARPLDSPDKARWVMELAELIASLKRGVVRDERLRSLAREVGEIADGHRANASALLEQQFRETEEALWRALGEPERARAARREIGESLVREAAQRPGLAAAIFLGDAMKIFGALGDRARVEELKGAYRVAGADAAKSAKTISATVEIPSATLADAVRQLIDGSHRTVIARLAAYFCPSLERARADVAAAMQDTPLQMMISRSLYREGIALHESREQTPAEREADNLMHMLRQQYSLGLQMMFRPSIEAWKGNGATPEEVVGLLRDNGCFDEPTLEAVALGLRAYWEGRDFEATHLLLPQLEDMVRQLGKGLGRPVLAERPESAGFREVTLDSLLGDDAVKALLTDDVTTYLSLVLADPRGDNLRNLCAHGLLKPGMRESAFHADLALHVLLVLALARRVRDEGQQQGDAASPEERSD